MIQEEQYAQLTSELLQKLKKTQIFTDELRTLAWGTDASFYRMLPRLVVQPNNEEELCHVVRICHELQIPFTFRAAGTSLSGQALSDSVLILAGKRWENYSINRDASAITLQPGIVGAKVNRLLRPYHRVFPPDPASIGSAMVGGIVANNASGMNCGVHANSDRMLISARMVLTDGTILDTGNAESRRQFAEKHSEMIRRIEALRDKVCSDAELKDLISRKYSIKNVTGLNIRPLIAYKDPFDIIAHSLVGSEGTLAFISEVTMKTLQEYPYKASAMVYFLSMKESCEAVVALKQLIAGEEDEVASGERLMVKSAEMLDYMSLKSVDDPVYLKYCEEYPAEEHHHLTAILLETKALTHEDLQHKVECISQVLHRFRLYRPIVFTEDPQIYGQYWAIRSGIFPSVGGQRPEGTSCLIEDVAFPIESLPEATTDLQQLIAQHGYADACIYGHAFEGNYHFILNQRFDTPEDVSRYEAMMRDVAQLVVEKYGGSLKAEHGTGRNMAPFVSYEWGEKAFNVMRELKAIFDPKGLLNPGVIFNNNPQCFIQNLKPLPVLDYPYGELSDSPSIKEAISGAKKANKCIECGFCEVNCVSCGLTMSSRIRIAAQREIISLQRSGIDPQRLSRLQSLYQYYGNQTCAADGLCATSCPMKINTADVTHLVRQFSMNRNSMGRNIGNWTANHMENVEQGMRIILDVADTAHRLLGTAAMKTIGHGLHQIGMPLWSPSMPESFKYSVSNFHESPKKVVYFPSCINQTMGLRRGAPTKNPLVTETCELLQKAGYQPIFPEKMNHLCCGQIWESKGMMDIADQKSRELETALEIASDNGRYPILCDQSPCLHRMRKMMPHLHLYEPVEFTMKFLKEELIFHPIDRKIAVHITCSTRLMGLTETFISLAHLCSTQVLMPEDVGCCGFAGDKGFTQPELNQFALRHLRPQIELYGCEIGYSNSRTCEIGLETHSGIPYLNIIYLVNECTTPRTSR